MQHLLDIIVRRQQDDSDLKAVCLDLAGDLDAIDPGQVDIDQGDIRAQFLEHRQRFFTTGALADHLQIGLGVDDVADTLPEERVVVDNDDADLVHCALRHRWFAASIAQASYGEKPCTLGNAYTTMFSPPEAGLNSPWLTCTGVPTPLSRGYQPGNVIR